MLGGLSRLRDNEVNGCMDIRISATGYWGSCKIGRNEIATSKPEAEGCGLGFVTGVAEIQTEI